jgi:hypothetical protein
MKKIFYKVWHFLKEKAALAQVFFQLKMDGLRLQFAIYMANALQKARSKRFYVIENAQGKLIWLCNDDIKEMKKPKKVRKLINGKLRTFKFWMLNPKTTHLDIMRDCLYFTADSLNNNNGITVEERNKKQKKWIAYMEKVRMDRIFGKYKLK